MPQIPPINDAYVDDIIKSVGPYNPALNKTQGVKLRELVKLLRDRYEQEISLSNVSTQEKLLLKADLINGTVPSSQLPSFVDDVLEYPDLASFPASGENGKIYIALNTNKTYRWSGSVYVLIASDLALGETAQTAYRGDRGKEAYEHSKITVGNPHGTTKGDIGLGNVDNTSDLNKPVSTAQATVLNAKLTATLATDAETQITAAVTEDNKVVSRSKLYNWWTWLKTQALTWGNKITLMSGTSTTPPLVMPVGTLTATPQNGAVERDSNGRLWTTRGGVRYRLVEDDGSVILLSLNLAPKIGIIDITTTTSTVTETVLATLPAGTFSYTNLTRLNFMLNGDNAKVNGDAGTVEPTETKVEYILRLTNATFDGSFWMTQPLGTDLLLTQGTFSPFTVFGATKKFTINNISNIYCNIQGGGVNNILYNDGNYMYVTNADRTALVQLNTVTSQIVQRVTTSYADANNISGNNLKRRIWVNLQAFYFEKIRP